MKNLLFFTFLLLSTTSTLIYSQQNYDHNWVFGGQDGIHISFNADTVTINYVQLEMRFFVACTSLSDSLGNLLFYTNGCYIANASHEMMENGDNLNPGFLHDAQCSHGYPASDAVLAIPKPGSLSEYYLFHQAIVLTTENGVSVRGIPLYVTTVDMSYNNGLGKVTQKNQVVINDTLYIGHLDVVRHTNGIDWWILAPGRIDGDFYRLLVKSDIIEGPFFQQLEFDTLRNKTGAQSVFSPDGSIFVQYKVQDGIYIYSFDRSTGLLSNHQRIPLEEYTLPGGCAISPNSRFLYVNTVTNIYQFDLEADDIGASKILVAEYDGYVSTFPTSFFKQQLGPDCRIYINSPNGVDVLHVIKYPDLPGLACEVVQHGVQLPARHQISLPNFPHYRTGTPYPVCGSTSPVFDLPAPEALKLSVFPNPASEQITIRLTEPVSEALTWRLFDALGRETAVEVLAPYQEEASISVRHLPKGIYFYRVERQGVIAASGKVVVGM